MADDSDKSLPDVMWEAVTDRFKSYFLGNFTLAWLACHWQAIYVIVFLEPIEMPKGYRQVCYPDKVSYVRDLEYGWCLNVFLPLFLALAPIGAHFIDELVKAVKKKGSNWGLELRAGWARAKIVESDKHEEILVERDRLLKSNHELIHQLRGFETDKQRFEKEKADVEAAKATMTQKDTEYQRELSRLGDRLTGYEQFRRGTADIKKTLNRLPQGLHNNQLTPDMQERLRAVVQKITDLESVTPIE